MADQERNKPIKVLKNYKTRTCFVFFDIVVRIVSCNEVSIADQKWKRNLYSDQPADKISQEGVFGQRLICFSAHQLWKKSSTDTFQSAWFHEQISF